MSVAVIMPSKNKKQARTATASASVNDEAKRLAAEYAAEKPEIGKSTLRGDNDEVSS